MREKISTGLFLGLLIVIGVVSFTSIRWISSSGHLEGGFGLTKGLALATIFGLLILIAAGAAGLVGSGRRLPAVVLVPMAVLGVGLVLSTVLATDKRVALNNASGFAVGLALMAATYRLVDQPWKVRLAVVVLAAAAATFGAKTVIVDVYELDETYAQYRQNRAQIWAKQGKSLDDPMIAVYEARLLSRDNGGFFYHGNLGGGYLAMALMTALAAVWYRLTDREDRLRRLWVVLQFLAAALAAAGLAITYSLGPAGGAVLGLAFATLLLTAGPFFARRARTWFVVAVLLVATGAAGVVGYGVRKGTLPSSSLAYRWQYWQAGYRLFLDHPLAGVGAGNFGYYYTRYKLPEAEEEVSSPHNVVVQAFTEWGVFGGVGLLLLLGGIFLALARTWSADPSPAEPAADAKKSAPQPGGPAASSPGPGEGPSSAPVLLLLLAGIFGIIFAADPAGMGRVLYIFFQYWPYLLIFGLTVVIGLFRGEVLSTIDPAAPAGRLADGRVVVWLAAALAVMIICDLVNFLFFELPTQLVFFFIAGLALAAGSPPGPAVPGRRGPGRRLSAGAFGLAGLLYLVLVTAPAVQFERLLGEAESPGVGNPLTDPVYTRLAALARWYPFDAHFAAAAADRLLESVRGRLPPSREALTAAAEWYDRACARAGGISRFWRTAGDCRLMLAGVDPAGRARDMDEMLARYERAFAVAPRAKQLVGAMGLVCWEYAKSLPPAEAQRKMEFTDTARTWIETALALNACLRKDSFRRLGVKKKVALERALREIQREVGPRSGPPPPSRGR